MRVAHWSPAVCAAALVGACFGGGGSSGSNIGGGSPPVTSPNVTLSSSSVDMTIPEGGGATFGFNASYTGFPSGAVPDVQFSDRRFALAGSPAPNGRGGYKVEFRTVELPAGGKTSTEVTFRLCSDSSCATVYSGSTKTFAVNLDVQLADWSTFQRNAAHTGYVAVNYDEAHFQRVWELSIPTDQAIFSPAATRDLVLITSGRNLNAAFADAAKLKGLRASDGSEQWSYDMGSQSYFGGPAIEGGLVHVSSMERSSHENPQWVFDLATGALKQQMKFAAQWTEFNQPVAFNNSVYMIAGYFGNVVYAFDPTAGAKRWETAPIGARIGGQSQSPAVDERYVYYYSGALFLLDRNTGVVVRSIADPEFTEAVQSWYSAPVLDGKGNVFLYSSGRPFEWPSTIVAFGTTAGVLNWKSAAQYTTAFAHASDTIYAVRDDKHVLSAIDAATGEVKWSTPIPTSDRFAGNVVVTGSHAFVSTANKTWAVDLRQPDHKIVWEAPTGGRLAITPGNLLLTAEPTRMTAYKLF